MRAVWLVVLICGALGGNALAHGYHHIGSPPSKLCYQGGTAYKTGGYCYENCARLAACVLEVCVFTGEWMEVGPCKVRDCQFAC